MNYKMKYVTFTLVAAYQKMNDQRLFTEPHIWLNQKEKELDQLKPRITTVVG